MAHIANKENLAMTKDKELNLLLQIPPAYYYTAIDISKDRRYWNYNSNRDKYIPYFGKIAMDGHKKLHTIINLFRIDVMLGIFSAVGLISLTANADRIKEITSIFVAYIAAEDDRIQKRKANAQEKQWNNSLSLPKKLKEIAEFEKVRISAHGGIR